MICTDIHSLYLNELTQERALAVQCVTGDPDTSSRRVGGW